MSNIRGFRFRSLRLAVLAIGVTLVTAPAVAATESFIVPAGEGCAFDVLLTVEQPAKEHVGERLPIGTGDITITNMEADRATYFHKSRYMSTATFDEATNTLVEKVTGRLLVWFFPGDQGPYGEVGDPGAMFTFAGNLTFTIDLDTGVFKAFSSEGSATDICAELSH